MKQRQEVIDKLAELLRSRLVVADDLVEAVYNYVPSNPQGLSPIVAVAPRGTMRDGLTAKRAHMQINVVIYIYVLYTHTQGDIDEEESWTSLNAIENAISETLSANVRAEGFWYNLDWIEFSSVDILVLDNQGYLLESILTRVSVT